MCHISQRDIILILNINNRYICIFNFYLCHNPSFLVTEVSRKFCLQLSDELSFASNPFDERFRFCIHIILLLSLIIGLQMYLSLLNIPD